MHEVDRGAPVGGALMKGWQFLEGEIANDYSRFKASARNAVTSFAASGCSWLQSRPLMFFPQGYVPRLIESNFEVTWGLIK